MDRRVLVVDDDPDMLKLLSIFLTRADYEVLTTTSGEAALGVLHREGPPIVVSDWSMPGMSGLELCLAIRSSEAMGFVYIIMVTAHTDKGRVVEALEAGANDFLTKPFHHQELLARLNAGMRIITLEADLKREQRELHKVNAEMAILNSKLELAATIDDLTGLANRREAMNQLRLLWASSLRQGQPLSCVMMDIDHFKHCNDTHGHEAGDTVLRQTSKLFNRCARAGELVSRIGGEEFLVLCPNATGATAAQAAERFRAVVESNVIHLGQDMLRITISAGVAERSDEMTTVEALLKSADQALYIAKHAGRNRVVLYGNVPDMAVAAI
jgi:two-component system, cell cycle response regulator